MQFALRVPKSRQYRTSTRLRAPVPALQEVQRLEDRSLLSATLTGMSVEQDGATQAQDLIAFAQRLTDLGVQFYGAEWCEFCAQQKELFQDGAAFLPYIEAGLPDQTLDPTVLGPDGQQITNTPTWYFSNGTKLIGLQSLETLATAAETTIPTGAVPCFVDLPDVAVLEGSPFLVSVDGYDPNDDDITYTVTSSNSQITAELFTGNRSLRFDVAGYGDMVFELFENRAPRATNRIIQLAASDFYDDIIFHRVIDNFVIQAGNQTATSVRNSGLPDFDDQFDVDLQHNMPGLLSMAKAGDDTNGSQFFVTEVATRFLDFNHTIFGKLVEGEDNRDAISDVTVDGNDMPNGRFPVTINDAQIFFDNENAVFLLKAADGASGSSQITVTAMDSEGNSYTQTFTATVQPDVANGGPFLRDIGDIHVVSGEPVVIELDSIDAEGDAVVYGFDVNPFDNNPQVPDIQNYTLVTEDGLPSNRLILATVDQSGEPLEGVFEISVAVAADSANGVQNDTTSRVDEQRVRLNIFPSVPEVSVSGGAGTVGEDTSDGGTVQFDAVAPVVLRDDFDGTELDTSVWDLAEHGEIATVGRTELRTGFRPEVTGGVVRLALDTFNPFDPGETFFGSAIRTDDVFSLSNGLVFETRARLVNDGPNPLGRGVVAAFNTFGLDTGVRDEISTSLFSNDALDGTAGVRTSTSDDETNGQSANAAFSNAAGLDTTAFNTYRTEWFPDRVDFFVNDVLVRSETTTVPDDPMNLGLSFFAPDSGSGFDAGLTPTADAGSNQTWIFEVDFVEIRRPIPELTVSYSSTGTATLDADFTAGSGSVQITADTSGSSSATVPVTILQDPIPEQTETATLTVDDDPAYSVGTPGSVTVTITDDGDTFPTSAEVEVRLVINQTATDAEGETDTVPDNEDFLDEWDEFFAEIWVRVPQSGGEFGVVTASADLTYNTNYFTAIEDDVVFGASFTNGSFDVDDESGRVNNITATATAGAASEAGSNRFVLLARVPFASMGTDGVAIGGLNGYVTPMNDLNVTLENLSVDVATVGSVTAIPGAAPQVAVWPMMLDLDDNNSIGFEDIPGFSSRFNQSVASSPSAAVADYDHNGTVGFEDISPLASNFGRARSSTGRQTYPISFPEAWLAEALHGTQAGSGAASDAVADESDLSELAAALLELFRDAGLSDSAVDQLEDVTLEVSDLPGRQLGYATDGQIVIDVDGAGLGWFIDATPSDSLEFDAAGAATAAEATRRYDLLTALAHEYAHILGLEHGADGTLLDDTLEPGERRLSDLDELFSESLDVL